MQNKISKIINYFKFKKTKIIINIKKSSYQLKIKEN